MRDDPVPTRVLTEEGLCRPRVEAFVLAGVDTARPQQNLLNMFSHPDLRAVIICPSKPFVSIEAILAVAKIRAAIKRVQAPVIAVTRIIGGKAIKGPAAKMLTELEGEVNASAVAHRYVGFDRRIRTRQSGWEGGPVPGVRLFTAATVMNSVEDRLQLAQEVLPILDGLSAAPGLHHVRIEPA